MKTLFSWLLVFIIAVVMILTVLGGIAVLTVLPLWLIWNWMIPGLFGVPEISIFEALGLIVMARIIFPSSNINKALKDLNKRLDEYGKKCKSNI